MNTNRKIIITGGEGMIGSQANFGLKLSHKELDILDKKSIEKAVSKHKPDVILHLAAMTNMLACEENPKLAQSINVVGTKNIAEVCKEKNIKLVYMSTCVVFSGNKKTPYTENDASKPVSVYGKTKLEGEKVIQKILPGALIVRTGWLFGGGKNDTKFARAFYLKMKQGGDIKAVSDRYGSPTYVPDLLDTVKKLIEKNASGVCHIVNNNPATYLDVAEEIKRIFKFKIKVEGVKARDIDNKNLKRGHMEALVSSKVNLRPWKKALKSYLNSL